MSTAMPRVASISIYPVKSFGPMPVPSARIVEGGGLEHDREFALFDAAGKYVNGKRNPKVHQLTAAIDWKDTTVTFEPLRADSDAVGFNLVSETEALEAWLSDFFEEPVTWRREPRGGFPDDMLATGPTLVSDASYLAISRWYQGLSIEEIRRRFRANIEFACDEPFWEDRLYADAGEVARFRIGDVEMHGTNPCKRCIVPTRQTRGGETTPEFAQTFMANRAASLPEWSNRSRFDHFYRLAVNTRVPPGQIGKQISVDDPVELLGTVRQETMSKGQ